MKTTSTDKAAMWITYSEDLVNWEEPKLLATAETCPGNRGKWGLDASNPDRQGLAGALSRR